MKRSLFHMLMLNALLGSLMAQNSPIIYSMEDLRFKKIRDGLYTPSNLRLSEIKNILLETLMKEKLSVVD